MPWVCNECGIIKKINIHGYQFGGRLLEDVYFLATYDDNDKLMEVKIHPDYDDEYWRGFDTKKWLKKAKSYASDCDYEDCAECYDEEAVLDPVDDEGNPILEAHKFTYAEVPPSNFLSKLEIEKQSSVGTRFTPRERRALKASIKSMKNFAPDCVHSQDAVFVIQKMLDDDNIAKDWKI